MISGAESSNMGSRKQLMLMGERFLRAFYRLIQTVKIHQDNHQYLMDCAKDFVGAVIQGCVDEDHVTIQISHGRLFLQDEKFPYRREIANLLREMLDYFEKRELKGLRFYSGLRNSSLNQIVGFAHLLNDAEQHENSEAWLGLQIKAGGFSWLEIIHGPETSQKERELERKEIATRTYSHALASVKRVSQKVTSQRRAGIAKLKRVVQNMVDLLVIDEPLLLSMSTIRDHDDYTYTHSVNVAILSMCLGKRIRLSQISLMMLGICGLVHDLGKLDIPLEILNKPGELDKREIKQMEKHPFKSGRRIITLRASRDLKAKIFLPSFEHHFRYDLSGYPRIRWKKPMSLFGKVLAIADVFDAMTSPRIYRPGAISPDRASGLMLDGAGKEFDPILLKVFIDMLGVYPVGTLLQLDTGETGLVVDSPQKTDLKRPRIVLLVPDGQGGYKKGKVVNLSEQDPHTGSFRRNVIRSLHPSSYGIQPVEFLI